MDLLLSLPIASYFLTTSLTSWSTSLNLLFFYMTWSTLVLSHSPLRIELIGTGALRIILWLIPSLIFLLFDTLLPSLSESIKHKGSSALPPREAAALFRTLGLSLLNLTLETGLEAGVSVGLTTLLGGQPVFRTSTTLPLPWQMAKHLLLLFTAREVLTYYIHAQLLHGQQRSYRCVAKPHQQWGAHARSAPPFSLQLMADHPGAFLLHRFIPLYVPALLLALQPWHGGAGGLHLLTYFVFFGFATVEETLTMSGYSVVPGIMLSGMARRCATHYSCPMGNFGTLGLLDWVHGTSLGKDVMADAKAEAGKHSVKERGAGAASDAGNAVQQGIDGLRRSARRSRGKNKNRASSRSEYSLF